MEGRFLTRGQSLAWIGLLLIAWASPVGAAEPYTIPRELERGVDGLRVFVMALERDLPLYSHAKWSRFQTSA